MKKPKFSPSLAALLDVASFGSVRKMSSRTDVKSTEENDELEYNITFPVSTSGSENEGAKEPVIYLFGWTGSTDKLVAKYSALYEKEGCITLRYTVPTDVVFSFSAPDILQSTAKKLLQLLDDYELRENPVMFHVFSNGGSLLYRWDAKIDVIGVIFDSAPSRLELIGGFKAVYLSQRPKGFLYSLLMSTGFVLSTLKNVAFGSWNSQMDFYQSLKASRNCIYPHLFLYSKSDFVVPWQQIVEMANAKKMAGAVFVRTHEFPDSPHVMHLKFHKEEYTEECVKFVDECLRIYDGEDLDRVIQSDESQSSSVDPAEVPQDSHSEPSSTSLGKSSQSEAVQ